MINAVGNTTVQSSTSHTIEIRPQTGDHKNVDIYDFKYHPKNDEYYPYRRNGRALYVTPMPKYMPTAFELNETGLDYGSAEKFFSTAISPTVRGGFYSQNLEVREFLLSDRRYVWPLARQKAEERLVGQLSVFSKGEISAGTCIGAYAGEIINKGNKNNFDLRDVNAYGVKIGSSTIGETAIITGDGALSRINGIFEYDEGRGWHERESGYNIIIKGVTVYSTEDEEVMLFPCYFTISDIKFGEELRVHYQYDVNAVNRLMIDK